MQRGSRGGLEKPRPIAITAQEQRVPASDQKTFSGLHETVREPFGWAGDVWALQVRRGSAGSPRELAGEAKREGAKNAKKFPKTFHQFLKKSPSQKSAYWPSG
jgi:hypothetical protein